MADVITRFRLETTQFDSKLRDASKNMSALVKHMSLAGDEFGKFTQSSVEQARALGKIESGATNLKDKLKDLVGAYNDVARQYNVLTKEQQNTEFGKALAESLQTLQGRIRDTKAEMNAVPGVLDKLADKFTVNVDAMKLFDMGLQAASAALDVAKDAFLQSESNIDEWGRTVEGAKGAYDVFLDTLNSGNWSSFFSNLEKAIQGGRDLYDALDRLGSIKANNQAAIALVQQQIQQLRVLKQQGKDVDDQIKSATQRLKELQGQSVTAGRTAGRMEIVNTLRNEVAGRNATGVQVSDSQLGAAAERILKEGQSYIDGMRKVMLQYEDNAKYQSQQVVYSPGGTPTTEARFDISRLTKEQQQQYLIAKAITEGETRVQQGISTFARAVQEGTQMTREEFRGNRYALQGSGSTGGRTSAGTAANKSQEVFPVGSMKEMQQELKSLQEAQARVTDTTEWGKLQEQIDGVNERMKVLKGVLPDGKTATFSIEVDAAKAEELLKSIPTDDKAIKVNIEQGKVDMPDVPVEDKTIKVNISADTSEALMRIDELTRDIEGRTISIDVNPVVQASDPAKMGVKIVPLFDYDSQGMTGVSQKAVADLTSKLQTAMQTIDIGSPIIDNLQHSLADSKTLGTLLKASIENGLDMSGMDFQGLKEQIAQAIDIPDETFESLADSINEQLKEMGIAPVKIKVETVGKDIEAITKAASITASVVSSIGAAFNSIEDPAAKVMGTVAQAIATIALGYAQATAQALQQGGPWAWIAFAATGLATMVSSIAAIKSATKGGFAEGGIVPGNSFNDQLRTSDYGISSGELILNKAQQNSIAGQLEEGGNGMAIGGTPYVTGETVILGINNTLRRQGRGELVTTGTLRRLGIM